MSREKFFRILFEPGELTCFAHNLYETELYAEPVEEDVFFAINPMTAKRADSNVICYRNILIECDNTPLDEQIEYVERRLPVTSIVYSGGKSYHFIISLAESCSTREEYDDLVARIHVHLPAVDKTTKNPSRFSRVPGATRPDTKKVQELVYIGERISKQALLAALPPVKKSAATEPIQQPEGFFSSLVVDAMFQPDDVMQKIGLQGRNQFFFWLGQRLKEGGASKAQKVQIIETTYSNLKNKSEFKLSEAKNAARIR